MRRFGIAGVIALCAAPLAAFSCKFLDLFNVATEAATRKAH
jgi:hypothetical protein